MRIVKKHKWLNYPASLMWLLIYAQVQDFSSDIIPLPVDFLELQEICKFIKAELEESPKDALLCMGAAAHLVDVYSS